MAALGAAQWVTFGNPLKTGYDYWHPGLKIFDLTFAVINSPPHDGPWVIADALKGSLLQWVCPCPLGGPESALPNLFFYLAVVLGFFWLFTPPFTALIGIHYAWNHRKEPGPSFALWLTFLSLILYTGYFYQGSRFMAAPVTLLGIYSSVSIAQWIRQRASHWISSTFPA
jgi:hypothetical protein